MKPMNTLSARSLRTLAATAAVLTVGGSALVAGPALAEDQPAASTQAQQAATTTQHTYPDGAVVTVPTTWEQGKPLTITGKGFLTADKKSGSTVAVKYNRGQLKNAAGSDVWATIDADANGGFTAQLPFPSTAKAGDKIDLFLLSGSIKDGDTVRGGLAGSATVQAPAPATTTAAPSPSATTTAPTTAPTTTAPTSTAPTTAAPTTPAPTTAASTTAAPTTAAPTTAAPTTAAPTTPAPTRTSAPAVDPTVHSYADGATVRFPETWEPGKPLKITGTGFTTADGKSGSRIAIKLNKGDIDQKKHNGGVWLTVEADAQGNFTAELPYPTTENSTLAAPLKDGDTVGIYLLTGTLKDGDRSRGGLATTYVFSNVVAPSPSNTTAAPGTSAPTSSDTPSASTTGDSTAPATSAPADSSDSADSSGSSSAAGSDQGTGSDQPVVGTASDDGFANCTAARAKHSEDMKPGDPGYAEKLDRDNDGVACESDGGNGVSGISGSGTDSGTSENASDQDLAQTGASDGTATVVAGSLLAVVVGAALVVVARRRRQA